MPCQNDLHYALSLSLSLSLSIATNPVSFIQIYSAGSGLEGALGNGNIQSSEMTVEVDTTDTFREVFEQEI